MHDGWGLTGILKVALVLIVTMFEFKFLLVGLILVSALPCLQKSGGFANPVGDLGNS